jgi:hypothetical protein
MQSMTMSIGAICQLVFSSETLDACRASAGRRSMDGTAEHGWNGGALEKRTHLSETTRAARCSRAARASENDRMQASNTHAEHAVPALCIEHTLHDHALHDHALHDHALPEKAMAETSSGKEETPLLDIW